MDGDVIHGYAFEGIDCLSLVQSRCYHVVSNTWRTTGLILACQSY